MIYQLRKNNHHSILIVELGDLKAKKKLGYYRKRGWRISAKEQPDPVSKTTPEVKVLPKKNKKKEESLIKVLGYWVGD